MYRPTILLLALLAAGPAAAQSAMPEVPSDEAALFDPAARLLREQSFTRSCEAFKAYFQKVPAGALQREARVKQAIACSAAGYETSEMGTALRKIAEDGPVDLARALANAWLVERGERWMPKGGNDRPRLALEQLGAVASRSGGRWATEARARFMSLCFSEMENGYGQVDALAERVLAMNPTPAERGRALLARGRTWLHGDEKASRRGEKDLLDVGAERSEYADDALYELASWREARSEFEKALELYGQIVKRFDPTNSNRRRDAESRITEIKRPTLSLESSYTELPGDKTQVRLQFRNLTEAKLVLTRADPREGDPRQMLEGSAVQRAGRPGQQAKTWTETLKAPGPYRSGTRELSLDLAAGSWTLEATTSPQGPSSGISLLVTPYSNVLKAGGGRAAVFTTDAFTGQAVAGADVTLYYRSSDDEYRKLTGKADATGLCVFDLGPRRASSIVAWSGKGEAVTTTSGWGGWREPGAGEMLSYVLTDRPLYKPGETVGLKVFVRVRKGGPAEASPDVPFEVRVNDASGREVDKRPLKSNAFGTASFELKLGKDAQLGQYTVYTYFPQHSVRTDYGRFRVEEYKPPEYTVSVEPVGKPRPGETVKVKVAASFFFGGPVANASGRAIVTPQYWSHAWKPWPELAAEDGWAVPYGYGGYYPHRSYDEDGPSRYRHYRPHFGGPARTLTFKTDAAGTAILEIPPDQRMGGDHSYSVQVFVTDASRREVTGSGTVNVSATPVFVDLRTDRLLYKPGERVKVELRAEDANGNAEAPAVELKLVRLDAQGASGEILKKSAQLASGKGTAELDADALGPVRVEVRAAADPAGPVLASTDLWLTNEARPIVPPQEGFLLLADHTPLKVGGTVRALVVTPRPSGHALVTLEGDRLWSALSVEVRGRARLVELPLTGLMVPNVWLSAGRLEQGQFFHTQQPVVVSGSDTALDVQVKLPAPKVEPGTKVPMTVSVAGKGGPAPEVELAVAVVDEAIYAIEKPRNDFLSFFARAQQGLQVNTTASVQQRAFRPRPRPADKDQPRDQPSPEPLEDMGRMEEAERKAPAPAASAAPAELSSAMGPPAKAKARAMKKEAASDDEAPASGEKQAQSEGPQVKARTNFSSSAGWFPELAAGAGRPASLKPTMPDSLTSWRVTAYAVTAGQAMGMGKATLRTDKPLMVRLQGPRFFTERDEVTLSAIVTSRLEKAAEVDVAFEVPGLKALTEPRRKVQVAAGGDARVDVRYLVEQPGEKKVKVTARAAGQADAMEWTLQAVVHGSAQRQAFAGRLSDSFSFKVNLPEKRNPQGTALALDISPSVLGVMLDALPYLAQYPYGCVEQTLSRFVPAAIAAKVVNRAGATSPRVPQDLDQMVEAGLKRLYSFQHGDGGWGWWQTDPTNRWMSAYAVYGLWLGREAGLKVDDGVLQRGRGYLASHLGEAQGNPDEHAFMLFSLAVTGGAPKQPLTKAFENRRRLSNRGRALLALALQAQKDPRARIAVENLDDIIKVAKGRGDASVGEADSAWATSAVIEATAYALMAAYRHDPNAALVKPLTDFLVLRRNGGKWRSTRDSAFALYALADIAMKEDASSSNGTVIVLVNGREAARMTYRRGGAEVSGPLLIGDAAFRPGENLVEVRRDGRGTGYWAATWDVYNQDENVKGVGGDVKIARRYTVLGRPGAEKASSTMEYGMALESGERVRVDLDITANKAVEFVMLEDLKPAGMEAVLQKSGPEVCNYSCTHAELRTDRVAMFLTDLRVGTVHLSYELRAEVPGRFHGLPARFEAMYAPEIKATSDEIRLEVRDAVEPDKGVAGGQ